MAKDIFERTDGDIRGCIASVDATSFIELIRTQDGRAIKRQLFEENLRVFLGENGGYNAEIIATAKSSDKHLFWYLNNGITITCKKYSFNKGHAAPIIQMEDLQIVNGAQTSHSLFEVATSSPDALTDVILTVRVYETSRADIIERVAVATNSQARIQSRDLRANNNVLKKMEYAFAEKGYFFERKRNMHSDKDPKRRIDALKLGQVIMAYLLREPEKAKTDSNAIFGNLFPIIFNEHHNIDALCTIYQVYQQIETMRDNYICKQEDDSHDAKYQYLVYGHWFVLYTVMLLVVDSKEPLKSGTGAIPILEKALDVVAAACGKSKPTSHYQLFRSPKTKDRIIVELDGRQPSLFSLLVKSNDGWLLD